MTLERRVKGTGNVTTLVDGELYRLRYRVPGEEKPRSERVRVSSYSAAEKILRARIKAIDEREVGPEVSLDRLFDLVLADHELKERADKRSLRQKIAKHLRPVFGALDVYALKPEHIRDFKLAMKKAGAKNATINRSLSVIRRALRLGRDEQLCNVTVKVEMLPEKNARQGFVEREVYLNFRNALPEHQRPLWIFAYHTGVRKGELLKFRWTWVYLEDDRSIIKIPGTATKNGHPRTIPIYGEMLDAIAYLQDIRNPDCPYLFQYRGEALKQPRKAWEATRESLGYADAEKRVLFHDLRRTAVRNMERAGIPRSEAMQISGHRTESTYKRYDIASERGAIAAGETLARFHAAQAAETESIVSGIVSGEEKQRAESKVVSIRKSLKNRKVS